MSISLATKGIITSFSSSVDSVVEEINISVNVNAVNLTVSVDEINIIVEVE